MNNMKKLAIAAALPFQILLVSSLTFYFGNRAEITFDLINTLPALILVFGFATAILLGLIFIFKKHSTAQLIVSAAMVGLALAVWIQSQLFSWNFGPLDGRGIPWEDWRLHGYMELFVWAAIVGLALWLTIKKNAINSLAGLTWVLGIISLGIAFLSAPPKLESSDANFEAPFLFHPDKNTIVILLDTFQSDVFELITKQHPEEVEFLDGFTFYRNTISSYPTTAPNVPAIFTGVEYINQMEFNSFVSQVYEESGILNGFQVQGYETDTVGGSGGIPSTVSMARLVKQGPQYGPLLTAQVLDFGFFRASPTIIKENIYKEGDWIIQSFLRSGFPPDYHGVDLMFLNSFEENARINLESQHLGQFHYYHFSMPHPPWRVNENLEHDEFLSGTEGYIRQARGALLLANRFVSKLKEMGIYETSEIIIMSDHGTMSVPPLSTTNKNNLYSEINAKIQSSSLSLFFHKKPNTNLTGVTVDDVPLQLKDLQCILISLEKLGEENCADVEHAFSNKSRKRVFFDYEWTAEYWSGNMKYMPPMTEYFLEGHAYDSAAWRLGQFRYLDGVKEKIERFTLATGEHLEFNSTGLSSEVVRFGWISPEATHRWTEGPKASLQIRLQEVVSQDMILKMHVFGYLDGLSNQKVSVNVNGAKIADWELTSSAWHEAVIPAGLVNEDGLVNLVFDISNPRTHCANSDSTVCIPVGMAVRELVIDYVH